METGLALDLKKFLTKFFALIRAIKHQALQEEGEDSERVARSRTPHRGLEEGGDLLELPVADAVKYTGNGTSANLVVKCDRSLTMRVVPSRERCMVDEALLILLAKTSIPSTHHQYHQCPKWLQRDHALHD